MDELIGFCGIACHQCKVFHATRDDDDEMRQELSDFWKKEFNQDISPEAFNCDGCTTKRGRLFDHCQRCDIRRMLLDRDRARPKAPASAVARGRQAGRDGAFVPREHTELLGYCGIECRRCKVFVATRSDDNQLREALSSFWKRESNQELPPEAFNCDGCTLEGGRLFEHCLRCEIRQCAKQKTVASCDRCAEYPCRLFDTSLGDAPESEGRLDPSVSRP